MREQQPRVLHFSPLPRAPIRFRDESVCGCFARLNNVKGFVRFCAIWCFCDLNEKRSGRRA